MVKKILPTKTWVLSFQARYVVICKKPINFGLCIGLTFDIYR